MDERKARTSSQQFRPEELSEGDIESIWKTMVGDKDVKASSKASGQQTSVDTTPTTVVNLDYGGNLISLHPENLEEELKHDQDIARMTSVLRGKKLKPKSYLPQVILYDNVSHDRLLDMKMSELRDAHLVAERRAKRKQESFVRALERKQDEWHRRDARIVAKLEPENLPELTFTFGRLYNKPDFPYQAAIQTLSTKQPPPRALMDHARRRPTILPQVTNRPIYDDEEEEDKTFITKLPKMRSMAKTNDSNGRGDSTKQQAPVLRGRRRRHRERAIRHDWTTDARFKTLTDLLGEHYNPRKRVRPRVGTKTEPPGGIQTLL